MAQKQRSRIVSALVSTAMLISTLTPFSALAEDTDYILNISDKKYFSHNTGTTTQEDSVNLYYYGGPGSSIDSDSWETVSDDSLRITQTITNDWKTAFWTEGKNFSTSKATVFDIKFKVSLDDYTSSPYIGLRLYNTNNALNCNGMEWRGIQLTESEKDTMHHMRFVLTENSDGNALVKYSLDGAAYKDSTGSVVPEDNWGYIVDHTGHGVSATSAVVDDAENDVVSDTAQMRFMLMALPSGGRDSNPVDGDTVLDTSVNWEMHSFTAYQTDEIPDPPAQATTAPSVTDAEYIFNISDKKLFSDENSTISQEGSETMTWYARSELGTTITSDANRVVSSKPVKVKQTKMSEYLSAFNMEASKFPMDKNLVFDVNFKVYLDDYSQPSPYVTLKLFHNAASNYISEVNAMGWRGVQLIKDTKDDLHTARFVVTKTSEKVAKTYYSYDGGAYTIDEKSTTDLSGLENWGGLTSLGISASFGIRPVALPSGGRDSNPSDGVTELDTPVNWEIESITAYTTSTIPDPEAPENSDDDELLPTAMPVATAVPIPSELQSNIVRAYPEGRMKAAVISLDDGADWCLDSDLKAIEILKKHNAKATFNIVPGITSSSYLANLAENYAGMEVASHSNTHPQVKDEDGNVIGSGLDYVSDDKFKEELKLSKTALDNAWGSPIGGLAYPYSCSASSDPERLYMIQETGYRYARNCILTGKYDVPESFYDLNPTHWISIESYWNDGTVNKLMDEYKTLNTSDEWKMMFLAGHAWQFNADESSGRGDTWEKLEEFAQYLEDNDNIIWNPTTIELVDYVTACRQLTVSKNTEGSVSLYNPSETDVWANVDGTATEIPAGQTVNVNIKAEKAERDFVSKSYLLDIDDNIVINDAAVSDGGSSVNSTLWANTSQSTSDDLVLRQTAASMWEQYLTPTSIAPSDIITDKPVVIEARFRTELEDDTVAAPPQIRLALRLDQFNIAANSGVATAVRTPQNDSGYATAKFIVDPVTQKVYYTSDGKEFNSKDITIDTNSNLGSTLRLYVQACPNGDNMTTGSTAALTTAVLWHFDSIKMYKLEDSEALKLVSESLESEDNTADYTISVRNHYPSAAKSGTVIAALYSEGRLVKADFHEISASALTKTAVTGSFDVEGLTDYTVKAFLWDSVNGQTPFDSSYPVAAE